MTTAPPPGEEPPAQRAYVVFAPNPFWLADRVVLDRAEAVRVADDIRGLVAELPVIHDGRRCPYCYASFTACNRSGCGQRQHPGWRVVPPPDWLPPRGCSGLRDPVTRAILHTCPIGVPDESWLATDTEHCGACAFSRWLRDEQGTPVPDPRE